MNPREVARNFDVEVNLGFKNLVVGGCSFSYNNSDQFPVAWPYYVKDKCGFETVYDTVVPGAGNHHISHSVQWTLEQLDLPPSDTLVMVMWSGNNRTDAIVSHKFINKKYPVVFQYLENVSSATISFSEELEGHINLNKNQDSLTKLKSPSSWAVENYLYVSSLYNYLQNKGYKLIFLDFMDRSMPNRSSDTDILDLLPKNLQEKYLKMIPRDIDNIYRWCIKRDLLIDDDFHPSPNGHLAWTNQVLIPYLTKNLNSV